MLDTFKQAIAGQFQAALCTLKACIDACPSTAWNAPVVKLAYCQAAFHTLCYTDYYLGESEATFRAQAFHRDNARSFRDYEELEDRAPQWLYDRAFIGQYVQHCREKAAEVIEAETAQSLAARCGFPRLGFSRAELYVSNVRHIQHHAAQLSLRLRLDSQKAIPWIKSGWKDG